MDSFTVLIVLCLCGVTFGGSGDSESRITKCPAGTLGAPEAKHEHDLKFLKFKFVGCKENPCVFIKGKTYNIVGLIEFNYTASSMPFSLGAVTAIGAIPLIFGDFCDFVTTGNCKNIHPGTRLEFVMRRKAEFYYPNHDGIVRLTIMDSENNPKYCGDLHLKIQNADGEALSLAGLL